MRNCPKFFKVLILISAFLITSCGEILAQTTYYSRATGNWNVATTWSTVTYGDPTNAGTFPVAGDIALIGGTGYTITVTAAAACASITIGDNSALTVNQGLTVSGATTVGGGTNGTLTINNTAGTKNFFGLVTILSGATWNETVNEPIIFRGGITNNGTFTSNIGVHTFNTVAQNLNGSISIPNVTVTGVVLTNNNSLTVSTALTGTGGLTQAAGSTLNLGGTSTITV